MKLPLALSSSSLSLSLLAALLLTAQIGQAQGNNPLITLGENGQGTLLFPQSVAIPLAGVLAPDPGPGGLPSALSFNLLGPPALIAGDLFIGDPVPTPNPFSDVLRFNPAGTGGNPAYPASVVFYSNLGEGDPADTGFPSSFYTNTFSLIENALGEVTYTPHEGQPGFVPGFAVTYQITSTPTNGVPDAGTTVLLFAIGISFLFILQRALSAPTARV